MGIEGFSTSMLFLTYQEQPKMFESTSEYPDYVIAMTQVVSIIVLICISYVSFKVGYSSHKDKSTAQYLLITLASICAYAGIVVGLVMVDLTRLMFPLAILIVPPFGLPTLAKYWFTRNSKKLASDLQDTDSTADKADHKL
jgi:cation transport ATPase